VSYFNFIQRVEHHYLHDTMRGRTFDDMVNDGFLSKMISNAYARYLLIDVDMRSVVGNMPDRSPGNIHRIFESWQVVTDESVALEQCKERITNEFLAFGIAEMHWESTDLILDAIGLPRIPHNRPHPMPHHIADLSKSTIDKLVELNRVDLQLYYYAKELFMERLRENERQGKST
jgi:hypothetical protein